MLSLSFKCQYDFVYLPWDFSHNADWGHAFVNIQCIVDSKAVGFLWKDFQGFSDWSFPSAKVCQVTWIFIRA